MLACELSEHLIEEGRVEAFEFEPMSRRKDTIVQYQFVSHGNSGAFAAIQERESSRKEVNGRSDASERRRDLRQIRGAYQG